MTSIAIRVGMIGGVPISLMSKGSANHLLIVQIGQSAED